MEARMDAIILIHSHQEEKKQKKLHITKERDGVRTMSFILDY